MVCILWDSYTRWQCVSVATGHLAGCLDRRGLLPAAVGSSRWVHLGRSRKDFYTVRGLPKSRSARSHKAYAKKVTQCAEWRKKLHKTWQGKRWCGLLSHGPLKLFMGFKHIFSLNRLWYIKNLKSLVVRSLLFWLSKVWNATFPALPRWETHEHSKMFFSLH